MSKSVLTSFAAAALGVAAAIGAASAQAPAPESPAALAAGLPRHEVHLTGVYSRPTPDRRDEFLIPTGFSRTYYTTIRPHNASMPNDREASVGLAYRHRPGSKQDRLALSGAIAIARMDVGFMTYRQNWYFTPEAWTLESTLRRDYHAMVAQVVPGVEYAVLVKPKLHAGASLGLVHSVAYRKVAGRTVNRVNTWATEVYPGLFAQAGPLRLDVQYRLHHRKYRDDSGENNGLRVDTYNPEKWRLGVSYRVWSKSGPGTQARWGR